MKIQYINIFTVLNAPKIMFRVKPVTVSPSVRKEEKSKISDQ